MKKSILVVLLLLLLPSLLFAADRYVCTTGTGSTNGTGWGDCFNNFGDIVWGDLSGGGTLYIDGGSSGATYTSTLNIGASGANNSNRIFIKPGSASPSPSGHTGLVTIDASGNGIDITGRAFVTIDGYYSGNKNLRVYGCTGHGISATGTSTDITIRYITIDNNGTVDDKHGISLKENPALFDNWIVEYSTISNSYQDGINIYYGMGGSGYDGFIVRYCTITGNQDDGIQAGSTPRLTAHHNEIGGTNSYGPTGHPDGIQTHVHLDWVKIYNNEIYNFANAALFLDPTSVGTHSHLRVYNNILYFTGTPDQYAKGIQIYADNNSGSYTFSDMVIANNTIIDAKYPGINVKIRSGASLALSEFTIANNLIYNCQGSAAGKAIIVDGSYTPTSNNVYLYNNIIVDGPSGDDQVYWDGNTYTTAAALNAASGAENNSMIDPSFVTYTELGSNNDLHLQLGSNGINDGCSVSCGNVDLTSIFTDDYDGNTRSGTWDIGAYAYSSGATTYYVKNGGSDSNDGLSDATAWATIAKVNSTVSGDGDTVLFKCDSTWSNTLLYIDWDNATVEAYYGSGTVGVSGNKPSIQGTNPTTIDESNNTDGYPTNAYSALIETATGLTSVTIRNMDVRYSAGIGILNQALESNVINNYVYQTANYGIGSRDSTSGTHSGNTVRQAARAYASAGEVTCPANFRPASYSISRSSNITVSDNIVHESHGEGFQTNNYAHDIIFENNELYDVRLGWNIWCGSSSYETYNITVRNNLVWRTTASTYNATFESIAGPGIYLNDVSVNPVRDIYIYNNLFTDRYAGVYMGAGSQILGPSYNIFIYGNTFNRCKYGAYRGTAYQTFTGTNELKNNIFHALTTSSWNAGVVANLTWDYNAFDSSPATGSSGANDQIGNITLDGDGLWGTDSMDTDWFGETTGSSTIDNGVDLGGSPYNASYNAVNRDTYAPWDIGAWELATSSEVSTSNRCLAGTQNRVGAGTVNRVGAAVGVVPTCSTSNDQQIFPFSTTGPSITSTDDTYNIRGQTFLSSGETSTGFGLYCIDNSSDVGSQTCELKLWDTVNLEPTGSVLAIATVASSTLPNTAGDYFFAWSSPYTTTSGLKYVAYCKGISGGSMTIYRQSAGSVANSENVYSYDFGTTWGVIDYDLRGQGEYGCYE